jgi:serine/threonine protein kinase
MPGDDVRGDNEAAGEMSTGRGLEQPDSAPAMSVGSGVLDAVTLTASTGPPAGANEPLLPGTAMDQTEALKREQSAPPVLNQAQLTRLDIETREMRLRGIRRSSDEAASAPADTGAALQTLDPGASVDNDVFDERSPDGRFLRFPEVLGTGAYKTVYKGFDADNGIEVAWNKLHVERLTHQDTERVMNEVNILRTIQHPNIINLFAGWEVRDDRGRVRGAHFITELMTSGTLKQYIAKVKTIKVKVIRKWCRNVLEAIHYLHSCSPPIMHRDLKCDNIFINGNVGEVKIGDLGLSSVKDRASKCGYTVIGTPEFMAPELYDENYSEKVDIYAFGMCVLEMISTEYPYAECENAGQIFKKVLNGVLPEVLSRLVDCELKQVILQCLAPEATRPTALQLLHHPLFADWESDDGSLSNVDLMITPNSNRSRTSLEAPRSITLGYNGQQRSASHSLTSNLSPSPSSTTVSRLSAERAPTRVLLPDSDTIANDETGGGPAAEQTSWTTTTTNGNVTVTYTYPSRVPRSASPRSAQLLGSWATQSDAGRVLPSEDIRKPASLVASEQLQEAVTGSHRVQPRKRVFEGVDLEETTAPPTRPIVRVIGQADMRTPGSEQAVLSMLSGPDAASSLGLDNNNGPEEIQEMDPNGTRSNQYLQAYTGVLVLSVRIPVSGAVKRITFAFDPVRESAEQVAREMVEELHLDESQIEGISQAIQRQLEIHSEGNVPSDPSALEGQQSEVMPPMPPPVHVIGAPMDFSQTDGAPELERDLTSVPVRSALSASPSPPVAAVPLVAGSDLTTMRQDSGQETQALDAAAQLESPDASGDVAVAAMGITTLSRGTASPPSAPLAYPSAGAPAASGMSVVVVVDPPSGEEVNVNTGSKPAPTALGANAASMTPPTQAVTVLHRPHCSAVPEPVHESSVTMVETDPQPIQPVVMNQDEHLMTSASAQAMPRAISEPPQAVASNRVPLITLETPNLSERKQRTLPAACPPPVASNEQASVSSAPGQGNLAGLAAAGTGSMHLPLDPSLGTPRPPLDEKVMIQVMYGQTPALKRNPNPSSAPEIASSGLRDTNKSSN